MTNTPNQTQKVLDLLRAEIYPAKNSGLQDRLKLLADFRRGLKESKQNFIDALSRDFAKPAFESILTEIFPVEEELGHFEKHLSQWMRPEKVKGSMSLPLAHNEIRSEAKGLVLIIAPWNYPLNLALVPLVGALAAGNVVLLKPSELTPHVSKALREFAETYLPANRVRVLEGGKELSEELLREQFDHIFFTGSTEVGRIVMRAAAEHLTPVTLELGGKSPTIVAPGYPVEHAAERIVWGKVVNSGQTCVAPDYVFVHEADASAFLHAAESQQRKMQGATVGAVGTSGSAGSAGFAGASVISERHAGRLWSMLAEANIGESREEGKTDRRMPLHFVLNPGAGTRVMKEEIFGPILPVLTYRSLDEVEAYIKARPRPLALYIFSEKKSEQQRLLAGTHSGGVCINDCLLHLGNHHLPFGGSGASGLGNYHGIASFRTFTQQRSVLIQGPLKKMMRLMLPPYSAEKTRFFDKVLGWF